jgi:hypothetical protein
MALLNAPLLIGLKGILEHALFSYNAQYICMVEYNGKFIHVLFEVLLKAEVK